MQAARLQTSLEELQKLRVAEREGELYQALDVRPMSTDFPETRAEGRFQ